MTGPTAVLVLVLVLLGLSTALVCPDGGMCEDRNTCCQDSRGGYGCCPLPHAVICPDQESECPDDTTCCQLPDGSWGCCPLPKAVCCEDKRHCCPEGTQCDIAHSKCVSSTVGSSPLLRKLPARRTRPAPAAGSAAHTEIPGASEGSEDAPPLISAVTTDVVCPDKKSACPDETTCCMLTSETYGCCPLPHAVCCSDHIHCCPAHSECDLVHSTCVSRQRDAIGPLATAIAPNGPLAAISAMLPLSNVLAVPCNESVACGDGSTCCRSSRGDWACCPLPEAVCCDDHLHCCPHGAVCNMAASTCDDPSGATATPLLAKTPPLPAMTPPLPPAPDSKCDKSTSCPGKATCCRTAGGQWACCPLPQAVCCDDHQHCCPHGTVCNLEAETCDDPSGAPPLPWRLKVPALTVGGALTVGSARPDRNMCDAQTSCPRDTTCCFMETSRRWGCCPLPKAVCCGDGNHCCPAGHTCEPHRSSCSRGPRVLPWFSKLSARVETGNMADVKCDNKSSCATGATCCKLLSGEWGCCPLVKAVCCADHEHCCPQGYACNMKTGTCEKKANPLTPLTRGGGARSAPGGVDVACDGEGGPRCPQDHTCCRSSASEWSCCPSPQAVCCSDSKHCCPAGHRCDPEAGGCSPLTPPTWDALLGNRRRDSTSNGL